MNSNHDRFVGMLHWKATSFAIATADIQLIKKATMSELADAMVHQMMATNFHARHAWME